MSNDEIPSEGQLDLLKQMNDLLKEQAKMFEKVAAAMGSAANASQQMKNSTEQQTTEQTNNLNMGPQVVENLKAQTDGANALADALGRSGTASESTSKKKKGLLDILAKGVTGAGLFTTAINSIGTSLDMIGGAFSLVKGAASGLLGIFGQGIKTVTGFFTGLMDAAANYYNNAAPAMFQANQDIVKSFGNLDESQGKFVKGLVKDLGPAQNALKKSGSSLFAVLGNGAEVLKAVTAVAAEFGDDLVFLQDQIKGAVSELVLMQKGMGLTGDAMKNLGSLAQSSGGSLQDSLQDAMVASAHLSKKFGVDVKIIGKGLNAMASDMETFGHMGVKEMAAVATYSAKLGVEISALKGIMDKFDSFEGAAEAAGKLNEAFGMNIDTMKMMNAENPAERMDMLRQSLAETGKSFDELSRHEKKLMAQTMGMDMKSLQNAMSVDPDEMGFDDFGDAAEEAAEKMTPEQAMQDVAKSIEKLSHTLNKLSSGPLSNFINGFMQVIDRSPEMRALMKKISSFLKVFFKMGQQVAHLFLGFVRTNDGLLKQIHNIFDLERIGKFKDAVEAAFGKFFDLLATDPKAAIEGLWDDIVGAITNWSKDTATGAAGIKDTLYGMLETGIKLLHGLIPKLMEKMAEGIVYLTESLKDFLEKDKTAIGNVTDGVGGALEAAMADIGKVWGDKLWPAISDLMGYLWEKASPFIYKILMVGFAFIFGKALLMAAISLAAGAIVKKVGTALAKVAGNILGTTQEITEKKKQAGGDVDSKGFFQSIREGIEEVLKIKPMKIVNAAGRLLLLAAFVSLAMVEFAIGIALAAFVLKKTPFAGVVKALAATTMGVLATIGLIHATKMLPPKTEIIKAGIALTLAGLLAAGGIVGFSAAMAYAASFMEDVSWGSLMMVLAATAAGIIGSIAIAFAGVALFSALAGPQAGMAVGGLVMGAFLFSAGVVVFSAAIAAAAYIMSKVPMEGFLKSLVGLGVAVAATLTLVGVGALLGSPTGLVLIGLAALGLPAAAGLFTVGIAAFTAAIVVLMRAMSKVDLNRVEQALGIIGTVLRLTAQMIQIASPYAKVLGFGKDIEPVKEAMLTIGDMSAEVFKKMAGTIKVIEDLPIKDPKIFALKMNAIGRILDSTAALAQLGIDAGEMAKSAAMMGEGSAQDMMDSMSNFIQGTIDSITFLIYIFAQMAKGFSESDLKGANAIAGIVQAVADLAGGMMGPMTEIIGQNNDNWFSDNSQDQINSMSSGMANILTTIGEHLPTIVQQLIDATALITDPKTFQERANALQAGMKGIGSIAKTVGSLWALVQDSDDSWFGQDTTELMGEMFNAVASIMEPDGALYTMLNNMVAMLNTVKFPDATIAQNFTAGVDATIGIMDKIIDFGEGFDEKNQQLTKMGNLIAKWGPDYWAPHEVVEMLVEEAKAIALSMSDLQLNMEQFELAPLLGDVIGLGKKGTQEFTIKPKGVNITVNFNVTMDSEALATQIYKGNKKNKKEGFFVLTEEAKSAELEGTKGTA